VKQSNGTNEARVEELIVPRNLRWGCGSLAVTLQIFLYWENLVLSNDWKFLFYQGNIGV